MMLNALQENFRRGFSSIEKDLRYSTITCVLEFISLVMAIGYIAIFLYITTLRINHPFALEWMEGTSVVQIHRILSGQLLYVEPSMEYVPLIYPPLYYYVSAVIAKMIGLGFLPLRLVSLFSTFGCMAMIFLIVGKFQPNVPAQVIAVGLFSATFKIGGAWFDIARVDMLALFLALASLYCLHVGLKGAFISGLLMALSCLTKQTYLVLLVAAGVYCLFLDRKKALLYIISSVSLYGMSFLVLNSIHNGWYKYFVYDLPAGHTQIFRLASAGEAFWSLIFRPVGLLFLCTTLYFLYGLRFKKNHTQMAFVLIVGAILAISWAGILNTGGFNNVIIPTHAIVSVVSGMFLARALSEVDSPKLLKAGVLVLIAIQFISLKYPIKDQIPTASDLHAGQALLQEITNQRGQVYVPYHPELLLLADKKSYADWSSLHELNGGFGGPTNLEEWRKVSFELRTAFRSNVFSMIILDRLPFWGQPERHYQMREIPYADDNVFYPVTGWRIRPTIVYFRDP